MSRTGVTVVITQVDNGHIVTAGCATLVFTDRAKLITDLARWLEDPRPVEREYEALIKTRHDTVTDAADSTPTPGYTRGGTSGVLGGMRAPDTYPPPSPYPSGGR